MKNSFFIGSILLLFFQCTEKKDILVQDDFELQDSLNLPHYPYINYDLSFEKSKSNQLYLDNKHRFIASFFEDYWRRREVSGGLLVAKNGQIIYENYRGYSVRETKDTLTKDTPLHIASISKVLTALAILKLVEADELKLDQLVSNLFPAFPYKEISVRDLLNHRSGLPNYAYFEHHPEFWNTDKVLNNENVLEALIQKVSEPYSSPNRNFSYSNTNYALLALIIEKVTNLSYPEAMKYIVFDPLQMKNTFVFTMEQAENVSQSYTYKNVRWDFNFLDNIHGDKNIYSTPSDLFKMDKAMYSKEFLSAKLKDKMKQGYSYEKKGVKNYGLGIRLMEWDSGEKLWYHNGWWHGNYATYVRAENDSISIIALGNRQVKSLYDAFNLVGFLGDYPILLKPEMQNIFNKVQSSDSLLTENLKSQKKDSLKLIGFSQVKPNSRLH